MCAIAAEFALMAKEHIQCPKIGSYGRACSMAIKNYACPQNHKNMWRMGELGEWVGRGRPILVLCIARPPRVGQKYVQNIQSWIKQSINFQTCIEMKPYWPHTILDQNMMVLFHVDRYHVSPLERECFIIHDILTCPHDCVYVQWSSPCSLTFECLSLRVLFHQTAVLWSRQC